MDNVMLAIIHKEKKSFDEPFSNIKIPKHMHIAEVVTIAKSLPLLRLNTYKSLILSYSADYRRIFRKNL
jgi:hypothetical protein